MVSGEDKQQETLNDGNLLLLDILDNSTQPSLLIRP